MTIKYCTLCHRNVTPKRKIGVGTFAGIIFTGFIWILFIPFYKKRCPICYGDTLVNQQVENKITQTQVKKPQPANVNIADELKKLNELKECGALTQEEFESHKKKLLM